MAEGHIGVKQVRSGIGNTPKHRGTLRALGLARMGRRRSCRTAQENAAAWWPG